MEAQLASRSRAGKGATTKEADATVIDALWLATLQQICSRAAHEVKGALNGVAVNIEVVRSRAEKAGAPAAAVAQFANAAADQLNAVVAMTDAILWLGRAASAPVDISTVVYRLDALLGPAARADGRQLELEPSLADLGTTSADGNAVRLAVGGCLIAAVESSTHTRCCAEGKEGGIRIESCDGAALATQRGLVDAVASAGIRIQAEPSAIIIHFPR